jgi:hypothetical protein
LRRTLAECAASEMPMTTTMVDDDGDEMLVMMKMLMTMVMVMMMVTTTLMLLPLLPPLRVSRAPVRRRSREGARVGLGRPRGGLRLEAVPRRT